MVMAKHPVWAAAVLAMALSGCTYLDRIGSDELPAAQLPAPLADTTGASDPNALTDSLETLSIERAVPPDAIRKAVEDPERPDDDVARDADRNPSEVMAFAGIEEGQTILEIEAGEGYYTELFSRAVGPKGRIYMHNPASFDSFLGDSVNERLVGRLSNVTVVKTNFDRLPLPDASVDIVTWFQGPHELWFSPEDSEPLGDPEATFAGIARVLKPGGRFVVMDHRAPSGSPESTGGDTHRIDPQIVVDLATGAGLVVEGESDMLRSSIDDLSLNVFDERVRGKTDQFLVAFTKP